MRFSIIFILLKVLLSSTLYKGNLSLKDRQSAMIRLIEYAPWAEIRRFLPRDFFLEQWPAVAPRVRFRTRRDGMAFRYDWYRRPLHAHE